MQLSPWLAMDGVCLGYVGIPDAERGPGDGSECGYWRLWGNSGIDWTTSVGPFRHGGTALYFHSPDGWPAGEYWLEVDGPGDLEARLPVRLH